ncbi:MAG: sleB [Phenylobacterium sp.]|nr:sleB [Phenylobacterium sp.]
MLLHLQIHLRRHHVAHLVGAQLGLVVTLCAAFLAASATPWPAEAHLRGAQAHAALLSHATPAGLTQATAAVETPAPDAGVIRLQDLSPQAAHLWNAANPISKGSNPAAKPFNLAAEGVLDEARATDCMTAAIYYEAGFESLAGARAVAQVVINRMRNPLFPKTVCGVVFQGSDRTTGCQFTFVCDGALARKPAEEAWERARKVAVAALQGYVMKPVGNATHYHADYVAPYWSPTLVKVAVVGQHIFYRWTGGLGRPPAFAGRYAGGEMKGLQIATLDDLARGSGKLAMSAATSTEDAAPATQASAAVEVEPGARPGAAGADGQAAPLLTPAAAAKDAEAIVKAADLDWQGRPRQKGPPRIARPSGGLGAF